MPPATFPLPSRLLPSGILRSILTLSSTSCHGYGVLPHEKENNEYNRLTGARGTARSGDVVRLENGAQVQFRGDSYV